MEFYGGYGDYRHHSSGGGPTAAYHPYSQQHMNAARYGPASTYRNGPPRPGGMYDNFDRYGYPNASYNGYSSSQYGYNHTPEMRQNNYYSSPYGYDATAYRAGMATNHAAAYPSYHNHHQNHHHHRDLYGGGGDALYRSKSNYAMRDAPYQYPGARDYSSSYYGSGGGAGGSGGGGGGGVASRGDFYGQAQQGIASTGADDLPVSHHHNGYGPTYPEFNQNPATSNPYPAANGYASPSAGLNATGLSNYSFIRISIESILMSFYMLGRPATQIK